MPEYRFYAINEDGHIGVPPTQYELPNDAAANEKAKQLLDGHGLSLTSILRTTRPPQLAASFVA
jgi:hypothetical protein